VNVLFERSFAKDLKTVKNKKLHQRVARVIKDVKLAGDLSDVKQLTKMKGYENYYRIRTGDYRIGVEVVGNEVVFVRMLHRKNIYRFFP